MSTVSKRIADEIILRDGLFPGDHIRVVKVVKYQNMFDNGDAYGLVYENQNPNAYRASPSVIDPVTYWEYFV